jgi:hypothetical protein
VGEAEELEDAVGEVDELEGAGGLVDGGDLEGDERAEAGAVDVGEARAVEDDVGPVFDERLDELLEAIGGPGDEAAAAGDGGELAVVFVGGLGEVEVKGSFGRRCHGFSLRRHP